MSILRNAQHPWSYCAYKVHTMDHVIFSVNTYWTAEFLDSAALFKIVCTHKLTVIICFRMSIFLWFLCQYLWTCQVWMAKTLYGVLPKHRLSSTSLTISYEFGWNYQVPVSARGSCSCYKFVERSSVELNFVKEAIQNNYLRCFDFELRFLLMR